MLRRVLKYIRDNALLQPQDKVLVCVSGGADSVALLDVLRRGGYECIVAHCNFHLRGAESDRDEQFVRTLCSEMNVRLYVNHFDTFLYARERNVSVELAARELRYTWFEQLAKEISCQAIAVAHHQNDQAETVIMNLRRGTGIRGLCGIWPSRAIGQPDYVRSNSSPSKTGIAQSAGCLSKLRVIRPLLCTTHDYICHYLKDIRHIDWVEDSTNSDTKYRRNAIREELSHYTKAEIEHIAKTAEIMQQFVKEHTKHYGIIGKPLEHSFSKQWFTEFFEKNHILADYQEFQLDLYVTENGEEELNLDACTILDKLNGFNITYPYKENFVHDCVILEDPIAKKIGAANVVKVGEYDEMTEGNIYYGYNTDWIGFTKAIKPLLTKTDKKALILGTGGAAKAVNYALHKLGIKTQFVSRDAQKGLPYSALTADILHEYTIIVNCTPLGMYPNENQCPAIPYEYIDDRHLLFDCIYNPAETLFLRQGKERGARISNGFKMLEEQAKAAWEIWKN